jgi:hypothetical protein
MHVEGVQDAAFVEGPELPPSLARKIPARMVGRSGLCA